LEYTAGLLVFVSVIEPCGCSPLIISLAIA